MRSGRGALLALVGLVGCVDGFRGSNVQIDLAPTTPVQASPGATPGPGELPSNVHFRIYAIDRAEDPADPEQDILRMFEIQRFEIHKLVDLSSPCFIDVGTHVPFPGLHVSQFATKMAEVTGITDVANPPPGASERDRIDQATAVQRMRNVEALGGAHGIKAVVSASSGGYPPVDANCNGSGLPPPSCMDDASNARRLAACQAAWKGDPQLFEGTDRVLTSPLNGTTFGMVVGLNPVTPVPVGGASFYVEHALDTIDEYAIYYQTDGDAGPGTIFLAGRTTRTTRGVRHVHLTSPLLPTTYSAEMAIFADLGEDDVNF
ncbi:MAG: hypothetical protein ACTHU0_07495 [Kofleriaceae bacterium]